MDKGAFESKPEERERVSHPNIWKNFPSKLNSRCKGPEEGGMLGVFQEEQVGQCDWRAVSKRVWVQYKVSGGAGVDHRAPFRPW